MHFEWNAAAISLMLVFWTYSGWHLDWEVERAGGGWTKIVAVSWSNTLTYFCALEACFGPLRGC
jgi:hypothetical protein